MASDGHPQRCFMVGHIGADGSVERLHGDWVLDEIVRPAIETPDLIVQRADDIQHPGMIDGQIIRSLIEADLVVADLSMLNPNVLYEIGIRHMVQKPIVHMFLAGTQLPFDLRQFRAIAFSMEASSDMRRAREALKAQVASAMALGATIDNPVTVAMGAVEFERTASGAEQVLAQAVAELSQRMERVESAQASTPRRASGATLSGLFAPNGAALAVEALSRLSPSPRDGMRIADAEDFEVSRSLDFRAVSEGPSPASLQGFLDEVRANVGLRLATQQSGRHVRVFLPQDAGKTAIDQVTAIARKYSLQPARRPV